MRQNCLDISEVNARSDWACPLARTRFSKLNDAPAIEFRNPEASQSVFEKGEPRRFGSSDAFSDLLEVVAMQLNQVADCFCVARPLRHGGFAAVDTALGLEPHSSASLRRRNVSLTYFPFRRTWARREPDLSFAKVAKTCALPVR
jgi:hypothetical protein